MASGNMNISISDAEAAEIWKQEVEQEIEETKTLLDRVGKALQAVKDDANGTIVDEIYDYGTKFLTFANEVQKGMTSVLNVVGNFLSAFNEMISKGLSSVQSAISGISNY